MNICIKTNKEACPACQKCKGPVCYIEVLLGELADYAKTVRHLNGDIREYEQMVNESAQTIRELVGKFVTLRKNLKRIIE